MDLRGSRPNSALVAQEIEGFEDDFMLGPTVEELIERAQQEHNRLQENNDTLQKKRIELLLKQKEELAEGLHLIDFEQLKIENQSLNEKIEERNEELLKLQKKTTTTVQILTHVREKLQFVEKENISLTAELESLDSQLSEKRDKLGKLKVTRDTLRQKGRRIKANSVFITNPSLLDDIEGQKDKRDQVLAQIVELKKEHAALSDAIAKINAKTMALTQVLTGSGAPNAMQILRQIQSQKPVTGGIIPKATS
ncbi:DUF4201 domain-containing protein [Haematococcus lacustris]|uniref:DUF4201 domain-containing protein n=1 Tax=Haematococcus lacustris TaxID=44745 RepID=A0A699YNM8_HAELA|nr:DUF4201 domain-containing protein [Haematococcus lacustris]